MMCFVTGVGRADKIDAIIKKQHKDAERVEVCKQDAYQVFDIVVAAIKDVQKRGIKFGECSSPILWGILKSTDDGIVKLSGNYEVEPGYAHFQVCFDPLGGGNMYYDFGERAPVDIMLGGPGARTISIDIAVLGTFGVKFSCSLSDSGCVERHHNVIYKGVIKSVESIYK
jgi:hypothetical protein